MKVDLSKALEAVRDSSFIDGSKLTIVQVGFQRYADGDEKLAWKLYGHSHDDANSAWSASFDTFDEALNDIELKLTPKGRFIEAD